MSEMISKPAVMRTLESVGDRNKNVGWYTPTMETVDKPARDLLENYSHIAPHNVIEHILKMRDRAWEVYPYPCIGQLRFIDLSISRSLSYPLVLARLKAGEALLDLGCCFAQDIRKLVYDGAPATNLWGAELLGDFIELGYEMFGDRDTLKATFMQADLLDCEGALKALKGKMDMIHIGLFLHLWDWEGQLRACLRIVELLKPQKGVLILGQQVGTAVPGGRLDPGVSRWRHDVQSFERLWKEVGDETGTQWKVDVVMDEGLGVGQHNRSWDDPSTRRISFVVERL